MKGVRVQRVHRRVRVVHAVAVALIVACAAVACQGSGESTHDTPDSRAAEQSATPVNRDFYDRDIREIYTQLLAALATHDAAQEDRLTCAKDQGRAQRRVDSYPMSKIDYFGTPRDIARAGVPAATARLAPILAPASREAVQALVEAIISNDQLRYATAIQRVRREATTITIDRLDIVEIGAQTAKVDGAITMRGFAQPSQVIEASNTAVRENGVWKDCTPQR